MEANRYCLTNLVLGRTPEIELTAEQYERIKSARHSLNALTAFEEKFFAICEHYREIQRFVFDTILNNMLFGFNDIPNVYQNSANFGRIVLSYLSTARLYIDTSESGARDITHGSVSRESVKSEFSYEYDNCFSYRAMEAIRNFAQHNAFPSSSSFQGGEWNEARDEIQYYCNFHFALSGHDGIASLKASIRKEIAANGGKFDLVEGTRQHFGALCRIHQNLRTMFAPTRTAAIGELELWRNAWQEKTEQTKNIVLAAIEMSNDELVDDTEIYVGREMDSYRESIESKTSHLNNMAKRRTKLQ
jgi:hypothetical protein